MLQSWVYWSGMNLLIICPGWGDIWPFTCGRAKTFLVELSETAFILVSVYSVWINILENAMLYGTVSRSNKSWIGSS